MNNAAQKQTPKAILPSAPSAAVLDLIRMSQKLVDVSEQETRALLRNDSISFSIIQSEKEKITDRYKQASEEFRSRLEEFRGVEPNLLNKLESVQTRLSETTHSNNIMVAQMKERAAANTHKTLFTVQELAQKKPLRAEEHRAR